MDVSKVGSRTPQPPNQLDLGLSVVKLPLFTRIFWAAIDPLVQVEKLLSVSGQEGEHHEFTFYTRNFSAAINPLVQVEKLLSVSRYEVEHHSPQPARSRAFGREVAAFHQNLLGRN